MRGDETPILHEPPQGLADPSRDRAEWGEWTSPEYVCVDGEQICDDYTDDSEEECNDADDDCDGEVDEDGVCGEPDRDADADSGLDDDAGLEEDASGNGETGDGGEAETSDGGGGGCDCGVTGRSDDNLDEIGVVVFFLGVLGVVLRRRRST